MLKRNVDFLPTLCNGKSRIASPAAMTLGTAAALGLMLVVATYPSDRAYRDNAHHHIAEASDPAAAGRRQTTVRPISCEPLPNVTVKSITVGVVDYPPDAYTPRHRHPG